MDSYQFTPTQDWFSSNIDRWTTLFRLVDTPNPRALEIGSWEGRSAVFLLNNLCKDGGEIVCIDHFDLFESEAGRERFAKTKHNLALTGKKSRILPQFSVPALMTVLTEEIDNKSPGFDWIYVDGSHEADDTMLDAELVWRLARKNSIVIFDDYHWDKEPEDSIHHPKRGVDAFLLLHKGEYKRLSKPTEYQVIIQKLTEMRIGFLAGPVKPVQHLDAAFGYGINVAVFVDSSYAIGAAVTIRSVIETTPGRVTIYIVDCGLSTDDRDKLQEGIGEDASQRITIKFVVLPTNSMANKLSNIVWAKLDMIEVLPVERVLYLDADVMVRKDLGTLWRMDLQGNAIGGAYDVGYPLGHEGVTRGPYFNAGVLLMNLTKVREDIAKLREIGTRMEGSKFRDQDTLNAHYAGHWTSIGLEWNAQGLGTYARYSSEERKGIMGEMEKTKDPAIVHFTGPVNPPLAIVLNPWVQPPTAKPWGYLGAPGHPFESEWWSMLEKTSWKGFKTSQERLLDNEEQKNKAMEQAISEFKTKASELSG